MRRVIVSLAIASLLTVAPAAAAPPATTATSAATSTSAATATTPATATAPATATTPATTPVPAVVVPPSQVTIHHTSGDRTAAILLLIGVALALLIGALVVALASWSAREPEWLLRSRHATGEAGWRIANTWAEFLDFVRLGR